MDHLLCTRKSKASRNGRVKGSPGCFSGFCAGVVKGCEPPTTGSSGTHVEAVHRRFGALLEYDLDRVGGRWDGVSYGRVHPREHVVGNADAWRRTSDPDAHPDEVVSKSPDDGAQAVVPSGSAPDLDPYRARLQVQVVVDYDEVLWPVVRYGGARVVHEGRRFEERCVCQAYRNGGGFGLLPLAPGAVVTFREFVGHQVTRVVAGAFVGASWIAEADDDGGP